MAPSSLVQTTSLIDLGLYFAEEKSTVRRWRDLIRSSVKLRKLRKKADECQTVSSHLSPSPVAVCQYQLSRYSVMVALITATCKLILSLSSKDKEEFD